jgi:hypothetical protein
VGLTDQRGLVVAGRTEEEVFAALGLPFIPPGEREVEAIDKKFSWPASVFVEAEKEMTEAKIKCDQNIGACGRIFKEFEICEEIQLDDLCFSGCCMLNEEEEEESDE